MCVLYASVGRIPLKIKYSTKALQLCHVHNGKVIAQFCRILFFSCFFFRHTITRIHKQGNWICFIATRCSCSFTWISEEKSDSSIHTMKLFTYHRLYSDFYIYLYKRQFMWQNNCFKLWYLNFSQFYIYSVYL